MKGISNLRMQIAAKYYRKLQLCLLFAELHNRVPAEFPEIAALSIICRVAIFQ